MRNRLTKLVIALAAAASLAVGGSVLASAANPPSHAKVVHAKVVHAKTHAAVKANEGEPGGREADPSSEQGDASETAADTAGQAAACKAAGIDPNGSNVNYDDSTGTCTLDGGGNSGP
jgi:hypothetical protein